MKLVAWAAGVATLLASAGYMVVSLNRWEWNRALFFGLLLLIVEIGLATGLVLRKLGQLAERFDPEVRQVLEDTRPARRDRFRWLTDPGQTSVFVTFLVGGGAVLSGVAWLLDRAAARTTTPTAERALAAQLAPIAYPRGGFLAEEP